jgi:hypothetical protein
MPSRSQITLDAEVDRRAKERATTLGVSFAEYMRRLIKDDLGEDRSEPSISSLFGAGASGRSNIAEHKDE